RKRIAHPSRHQARHLRRAWRRSGFGQILPQTGPDLCQLLALPRAGGPSRRRPGGGRGSHGQEEIVSASPQSFRPAPPRRGAFVRGRMHADFTAPVRILFHFACRAPRAPRAKVPFPSALATCKAREGWHGLCMREGASLSRRKSIPGGALKPLTRGAANERANAERKLAHRQREAETKIRQSH